MTNFEWLYKNEKQSLYDLLMCYLYRNCGVYAFGKYCKTICREDENLTLDGLAREHID